ncbi:MAG: LPS assembly lipoprotein LptE [Candidatus Binatia bacterium]
MKAKGKRQAEPEIQNRKCQFQNWAVAVFLLWGVGCGYRLSGIGEGFPEGVRSVFVEPFVNRSADVSIDREMTSALRSEFHQQRQLRVVDRLEEADAVLSGVIRSLDSRVVAVNRRDAALQLETALVVDMTLRRRNPDEVLWRTQGTKLTEVYAGSRGAVVTSSTDFKQGTLNPEDLFPFTDIQLTEALSQEAREKLVGRFAHELHQRLIEMF